MLERIAMHIMEQYCHPVLCGLFSVLTLLERGEWNKRCLIIPMRVLNKRHFEHRQNLSSLYKGTPNRIPVNPSKTLGDTISRIYAS